MRVDSLSEVSLTLEPLLCLATLGLLLWRKEIPRYRFLTAFLSTRLLSSAVLYQFLHFSASRMTVQLAYRMYFYIYWFSFAVEAILSIGIVYELYKRAMAPLPGLQRLGMLMFRWAAGIAGAVAFGMACSPHLSSSGFIMKAVLQLQQTESILTLCLLMFVTLAIRPMGLSHRSRIFGVSLGLGLLASGDLISSSWLSRTVAMQTMANLVTGVVFIISLIVWSVYLALPEPTRQMIILPTTSPFLRWNQISLALGDAPGFVAVGGIDPAFLAPAEVRIMERASIEMTKMAAEA